MIAPLTITLFVPGQLVNPKNRRAAHWSGAHAWASGWRRKTRLVWLAAGRPRLPGDAFVRLTMRVGRLWDRTNLNLGVAPVQDEAMYLICEGAVTRVTKHGRVQYVAPDGPEHQHLVEIGQEVRPRDERGVLIEVEPRRDTLGLGGGR